MTEGSKITETPIDAGRIAGKLYRPADGKTHPGVIVVGGSGGGVAWSAEMSAALAEQGYAALALAYFRYAGLPKHLVKIPLEYFEAAIEWLSEQEGISTERLAVIGGSRGAELALLLGATFSSVKAVVGYAPSCVLWGPNILGFGKAPWTHEGRALPYVRFGFSPRAIREYLRMGFCRLTKRPFAWTPLFLAGLCNTSAVERAMIAVEKIDGPVLLLSGRDDAIWPASVMSEMIIERLAAHGHRYAYKHVSYEGAGHALMFDLPIEVYSATPREPVTGVLCALGGDPQRTREAAGQAWREVLAFLDKHVRS